MASAIAAASRPVTQKRRFLIGKTEGVTKGWSESQRRTKTRGHILYVGGQCEEPRRDCERRVLASAMQNGMTTAEVAGSETFEIDVDYDRSIEDLVLDGRYDWAHIDISSELFPVERRGKNRVAIDLICFRDRLDSATVLEQLHSDGRRPADVIELLTLAAAHPDLQRQFPIVARGSMWIGTCGGHFVPCLRTGSKGRYVDLYWFGGMWDTYYRFAVVREK